MVTLKLIRIVQNPLLFCSGFFNLFVFCLIDCISMYVCTCFNKCLESFPIFLAKYWKMWVLHDIFSVAL